MQKLNRRSLLLVGFTLFSRFFGAGNLIFPPYLGAQAGADAWLAFVGFAVSAIGLPVIGVIAVARAGGLSELAGRVHPRFAQIFALLVYLSIGPCLAIPRTASTSFQMLAPLIGGDAMRQLIYSIVFFAAAFFVALHPEKLTSWLGRILCPTLIVLIFVLFFGCLFHPVAEHYGVNPEDITSKKRNSEFVLPRQVVMYLCRDLTETSLANIGKLLGKKDHTTVIHGANKISEELATNEELKNNIEIIKKKICV